jgi:hygromycin-B 7''-O-kinase
MSRPIFESVRDYGRRFTDVDLWRPYVEEVCRRHGLECGTGLRSGLPGTHPVFLIEDRWVVKFFSDLFAGGVSVAIERDIYALLNQIPEFPAARLVASGALFPIGEDGWHWPYLVSTLLPGTSLGEVYDQVSAADREVIARDLGRWLRLLHSIRLEPCSAALPPDWQPFARWIAAQRAACVENHRRWESLPPRLLEQLDAYLPDAEMLLDRSHAPQLLHCDMNADHLLGVLKGGRWTTSGIIDFGDAKVGDPIYELVALHLGLFRCDKRLLSLFLHSYGSENVRHPDFPRRAMSFTLLHEFNVVGELFESRPDLAAVSSLEELADRIWKLEAHGST